MPGVCQVYHAWFLSRKEAVEKKDTDILGQINSVCLPACLPAVSTQSPPACIAPSNGSSSLQKSLAVS